MAASELKALNSSKTKVQSRALTFTNGKLFLIFHGVGLLYMISAHKVCQTVPVYNGELHILKDINLHIDAGESVAIVGASGSGKTTLLGMLAGLDTPSSGEIELQQIEITQLDEEQRAQRRRECVSFVFQNFQLLDSLSALENIMLPLEVKADPAAREKALNYLKRVGLEQRASHYPQQLSGGEQQRVALARAFACEAPIIFADEPTGNLDAETGEHITDLLFELNQENGTTLVMVTHSNELAERCSRQLRLHAGALLE